MPAIQDSVREMLKERRYATLGTQNEDGSIHLTPVWYVFENGNFYIGCSSSSRKARNAAAHPDATMLVEIRRPGTERWVSASGRVEILRGEQSREVNSRILNRYLTSEAMADPRIGPTFEYADDITICLIPEQWRSWSSSDLDRRFFGGILTSTPEKWFRPIDS